MARSCDLFLEVTGSSTNKQHTLSVSRLDEYRLHHGEYVLVCAHRGASMLRAAVEVVAEYVDSEAFACAFVMLERAQLRDGHSQLLAVEGCPVPKHFLLVEILLFIVEHRVL